MSKTHRSAREYAYTGEFNQSTFEKAYIQEFKSVPKFNLASAPDLLFVLGKAGADPRISDIRWTAYMLATVFIESSHTVKVKGRTIGKKGRVKYHTTKVWRNFAPIDETGHGNGKKYSLPVKVRRLPNGDAHVTEYDGDQWIVSAATGHTRDLRRHQHLGVAACIKPSEIYENADGDEQQYYGRGYVQLTWWSNYANAGVALGRGLALLLDPELVNDPDIAYLILSTGMYTGGIFANRHQLSQFFHGSHTDYVGARLMVNPKAKHLNKLDVAKMAERFETVLFASRIATQVASR